MKKGNIALFHPDIPQNVGAVIRTCDCFDFSLHLIRPFGFYASENEIKKASLDYGKKVEKIFYDDEGDFFSATQKRLILFSTKGKLNLYDCEFKDDDYLLFGSESAGSTEMMVANSDLIVKIPISKDTRSLNLANSVAIAAFEFNRQRRYNYE